MINTTEYSLPTEKTGSTRTVRLRAERFALSRPNWPRSLRSPSRLAAVPIGRQDDAMGCGRRCVGPAVRGCLLPWVNYTLQPAAALHAQSTPSILKDDANEDELPIVAANAMLLSIERSTLLAVMTLAAPLQLQFHPVCPRAPYEHRGLPCMSVECGTIRSRIVSRCA